MRRLFLLPVLLLASLVIAPAASADVQFSSPTYSFSENAGFAHITVTRTGPTWDTTNVYYGTHVTYTADEGFDYQTSGGLLTFLPGQTTATFDVPLVPHNFNGPPATFVVYLYGCWPKPQVIGSQGTAQVQILHDAAYEPRQPGNPLALTPAPTNGNPLSGATFYVNSVDAPAAIAEQQASRSNPAQAAALQVIASQPATGRFGPWDGADPSRNVFVALKHAALREPGAVPFISTYRLVSKQCSQGGRTDSPSQIAAYKRWVDGLSYGIGNFHAVLFLEMDSLITTPCLKGQALTVRLAELHYAISALAKNPHLVTYVDAGAADALHWQDAVRLLRREGISQAQGFFLNSTHFDWTTTEIAYGQKIARALGGNSHFVINTGENGRGPLVPRDIVHQGNEVLCNPSGRGLGPKPTANTGFKWVDAFAWTSNPGESGGRCVPGAPATGVYWPAYAAGLVARANFTVSGPGLSQLIPATRHRQA